MAVGKVAVAVLDQVQIFDQQIAPPLPVAEQGADFDHGLGLDLSALGLEAPLAPAASRVTRPPRRFRLALGHACSLTDLQ